MTEDRVQRRLAAILAADVAGYSRLMSVDEESALRTLKSFRTIIDSLILRHEGRIFATGGDSVLAEFASPVEAVRCAIAIQEALAARNGDIPEDRRMQFRIGVNVGDVMAEGDDLLGDGVNVAARLEGLAEPGGVCISGATYDYVKNKLPVAFENLGEQKVKNIAEPVTTYRLLQADPLPGGTAARPQTGILRRWARSAFVTVLLVAGVVTVLALRWPGLMPTQSSSTGPVALAPPDLLSIAVLPFKNLSDDVSQDYFVDGMTEDLITDLSKVSSLFVIARNSVFAYKDQPNEIGAVAKDLGVRYILEGSVRKSGERVRINAQLTDSRTGGHIWADRFDRELGDIFALQDDVTRRIVNALALELTSDEKARLGGSEEETSAEVYDLYLRGVDALRRYTPESIAEARTYFLQAMSRDPDYARAYAAMAFTYTASGIFFQTEDADEAIAQALHYGEKALQLDDTLPQGHFAMAVAYLRQGQHAKALAAVKKAIEYDPNYADGYAAFANILNFSGDAEGGREAMLRAMALNPHFSAAYIDILGRSHFILKQYDEAIANLEECVSRDPQMFSCHVFLASAYALAGRTDDARWEADEVYSLEPGFTLRSDSIAPQFREAEDREHYQSGLLLAGIPER
ncbi:MAG TPA: tetratricopeptide repeat protein [Afifellaceae bacterium]|nr:tetratricopeptide repeat protein [Afifellaceae bacterium]